MRQERNNKIEFILSIVLTSILTCICFVLLGIFYKAVNHTILINIVVWCITILCAYYIYFGFSYLFCKIFKKTYRPAFFNGWAIFGGLVTITLLCLLNSIKINDYLFVEIMSLISAIFATFEILDTVLSRKNKKND